MLKRLAAAFGLVLVPCVAFGQSDGTTTIKSKHSPLPAQMTSRSIQRPQHRESTELATRLQGIIKGLKQSGNQRSIAKAQRLDVWVVILTAKTSEEYAQAVRKLPVQVVRSRASDGTETKQFVAGGKVRLELPAARPASVSAGSVEPNSDRPGPALAATSDCYLEEEEPCLDPEEEEFWATEIAAAEAETDLAEADDNAAHGMWDEYCWNNSWDTEACSNASGPSVAPPCWQEALESGPAIIASVIAYAGAQGKLDDAILAGKRLSGATVFAMRATMVGAALTASWSAGYFLGCVLARYTDPVFTEAGAVALSRFKSGMLALRPRHLVDGRLARV